MTVERVVDRIEQSLFEFIVETSSGTMGNSGFRLPARRRPATLEDGAVGLFVRPIVTDAHRCEV